MTRINRVFDLFEGRAVSAIGRLVSEGEWLGDIYDRFSRLNVAAIPLFMGAVYYIDKSITKDSVSVAGQVFGAARSVSDSYDDSGLVRLRGQKNQEPMISLGMALHRKTCVGDDGQIKADAKHYPDRHYVRVSKNISIFCDHLSVSMVASACVLCASPCIVYFNDSFVSSWCYRLETFTLTLVYFYKQKSLVGNFFGDPCISAPLMTFAFFKRRLRSIYRWLFGVRMVRGNRRARARFENFFRI